MMTHIAPQTIKIDKAGEYVNIPFGGSEIGGFGTSYLGSYDFLKPAIAIHFPQGKFSVLFCPMINFNKGIVIKEENGERFAELIKEKHGILLEVIVSSQGFAMKIIVIE